MHCQLLKDRCIQRCYPDRTPVNQIADGDRYKNPQLVKLQRTTDHWGSQPQLTHIQCNPYPSLSKVIEVERTEKLWEPKDQNICFERVFYRCDRKHTPMNPQQCGCIDKTCTMTAMVDVPIGMGDFISPHP